jgi:hypothetical protein
VWRRHGYFQNNLETIEFTERLADRRHRCQLGQYREYSVGLLERSRRELAQLVEPLAPSAAAGRLWSKSMRGWRSQRRPPGPRVRLASPLRLCFSPSSEAWSRRSLARPAIRRASDHVPDGRRLDEKAQCRGASTVRLDRGVVDACGRRSASGLGCSPAHRPNRGTSSRRGHPSVATRSGLRRSAAGRRVRHLPKRKVLGEALRREAFGCALEQGTEGAPGRVAPRHVRSEPECPLG